MGSPEIEIMPLIYSLICTMILQRFSSYAGQKRKYMQANLPQWDDHMLRQTINVRIFGRGRTGWHIEPSKLKICPCFSN